ncbi:Succinate dehydrogenase subunit C [Frankia canadensis]|uniref:Succinate dehydrogenase subunit C n=1 Tax=Frankia canadensis TaxID=1836972 RepID=A0A2I2KTM4_9ACTN|nr:Succinate dehydrogenase subunit C [Frankia canadensis]SOU56289.1 Succinate dehydrogenase subunit C [Frankia canadensis]
MAVTTPTRPAPAARPPRPKRSSSAPLNFWRSTIGKKTVMAVTGALMLLFLIVHMLGNLKIFFGPTDFDHYAHWLRTIGEPVLHGAWFLWIMRVGLGLAVILHVVSAYQLSRRDLKARPTKYVHHQRARASYATHIMRYGGITLALFIVYHLLDFTTLTLNRHGVEGAAYDNVVSSFSVWWVTVIYIVAMLSLGLHIQHGFWSAAQTLGVNRPSRDRALKATATTLAVLLTAGFIVVPVAVLAGLVD